MKVAAIGSISRWLDDVTSGFARLIRHARRGRTLELTERSDGSFDMALRRNGAPNLLDQPLLRFAEDRLVGPVSAQARALLRRRQVRLLLSPSHFVFRPLELPRAAAPFIEGVVRAQLDRLTPWTASEAVFGWSAPIDVGADKVRLTVAATARSEIAPIEEALIAVRAHSAKMSTFLEEDRSVLIPIVVGPSAGEGNVRGLRLGLILGLAGFSLAFLCCLVAWIVIGGAYDNRLAELQGQIAERRGSLLNRHASGAEQALQALKKRKREMPSPVMILEALSKTLPDDAHLTELRIENGKVQVAGLAGDASQLIHLIEQSPQFKHAAFFAPTVRAPNGGEVFHIEARLEPSFEEMN